MDHKVRIRKNWKYVLYISILFMLAIIVQDIVKEAIVFDNNVDTFRYELNTRIKEDIFEEVDLRVREIESSINNVNDELSEHIIGDLEPLLFTINALNSNNASETIEVRQSLLLETVQDYNKLESKHCYYVITNTGIELYSCDHDEFTNTDISNEKDYFNRFYIQEIINEVGLNGSGQSDFYIEVDDKILRNFTYAVLDENTGYIIGIKVQYENYNELALSELIDNYSNYYNETDKDMFIATGSGVVLYYNEPSIISLNVENIPTSDKLEFLEDLSNYGIERSSGYFEYVDYSQDKAVNKIAYIKYLEEWDLVISSSVEKGIYDELIEEFRVENYNNTILIKVPIYMVLVILGYLLYKLVSTNINLSLSIFDEEEILYKRFADITTDSIIITNLSGEIQFINEYGRKTLLHGLEIETLNFNDLLVEEDGFYTIYGNIDTYNIKYNVEEINYHGEECDLYIIKDVTEKIQTEKTLKALTLEDVLTKLGNRRLLVNDFQDKVIPFVKEGNVSHLVMIDLDNFKEANDKYGHQFGDQVLLSISEIFKKELGESSNIYRVGGDEFCILTKGRSTEDLLLVLKQINQIIIDFDYGKVVNISFSAGVSEIRVTDIKRRLSDYYEQADEKLYEAKEKGKSIIVI